MNKRIITQKLGITFKVFPLFFHVCRFACMVTSNNNVHIYFIYFPAFHLSQLKAIKSIQSNQMSNGNQVN